jgi:CheY-like chemotaxis protein
LILMDMSLPGMDGWSAARAIRADPDLKGIPIIGLSAHAMTSERERALAAGCDDYLTKPIDEEALFQAIEKHLNARGPMPAGASRHPGAAMARAGLSSARVLLVDDEPLNLDMLEQELAGQGLVLIKAENGQEALDRVGEDPPDLIILDLMMPVLDGFQVLRRLQENQAWRDIPVIIVSASTDMENIVRGIDLGAMDFLPKPFEPAILHARLRAGLEMKRLHDLDKEHVQTLEREMEIGREIQAGFLPRVIPQPRGWWLGAHFQAAHEVAGDFYDVFAMGDGTLALVFGDVTDKGVGSALFMALYRSLLRATILAGELGGEGLNAVDGQPDERLLRAVNLVNRYICRYHQSAMYASVFLGALNTTDGTLCYVNAGHDPPYLLRGSRIQRKMRPTGPMVGVFENSSFAVQRLRLRPGDSLVMYTDGIIDALDQAGEMLGVQGFQDLLTRPAASPAERFAATLQGVDHHMGDAGQYDDIALLMVCRQP